jgi:magnesium-protoporphyrin O-methyltransferase
MDEVATGSRCRRGAAGCCIPEPAARSLNCCHAPAGLDELFDDRIARADARRYLRRGLPLRARRLLDALRAATPLDDATSLEVGGGAGGLTVELVRAGVKHAQLVDASPAYVSEARRVAVECGVADRVAVRHGNYAEPGPRPLDAVDVIVMDRVVCCFPDWQSLLDRATHQATRVIALTYPRAGTWVSLLVGAVNFAMRVTRRTFRMQHHPPATIIAFLEAAGFRPRVAGHRMMWEVMVATR